VRGITPSTQEKGGADREETRAPQREKVIGSKEPKEKVATAKRSSGRETTANKTVANMSPMIKYSNIKDSRSEGGKKKKKSKKKKGSKTKKSAPSIPSAPPSYEGCALGCEDNDHDEETITAATSPSSTGTLDTATFSTFEEMTPRPTASGTFPPRSPPQLLYRPDRRPSWNTAAAIPAGRVRWRVQDAKGRRQAERERWKTDPVEKAERDEDVFQTRLDVLLKNPSLLRDFKARVRDADCLTPAGVRMILHRFLSEMKMVEVLDDLEIEQDNEGETSHQQQPLLRLGIFASFGYGRGSNPSSASPTKESARQRARMFRSSGRRNTGGSLQSTNPHYDTCDDHSTFSFESMGLSLPTLDHPIEQGRNPYNCNDTDDYSSVGSVSVSGWALNDHRENSLRSLNTSGSFRSSNGGPGSGRSLLSIPQEEDSFSDDEDSSQY